MSSLIRALLEQAELSVTPVARAGDAIEQCKRSTFDLIVLDLGLPDAVGYEALEDLRRATSCPILVLSGRAEQLDRVYGLELGADDYLAKPFFGPELVARVRTLLRRVAPVPGPVEPVRCGPLEVDPVARQVTVSGTPVELTRIEFDLLLLLVTNPGRSFSKDELLRRVWGSSIRWQSAATVTEHVRRIRRKLGDPDGASIRTVHGVGYRFDPPPPDEKGD